MNTNSEWAMIGFLIIVLIAILALGLLSTPQEEHYMTFREAEKLLMHGRGN